MLILRGYRPAPTLKDTPPHRPQNSSTFVHRNSQISFIGRLFLIQGSILFKLHHLIDVDFNSIAVTSEISSRAHASLSLIHRMCV